MAEVLVVDDDRVVREGLAALLGEAGYSVCQAGNGEQALREVAKRRPDLVLLDVMMPGRSGFEICATLRQIDRDLPVIILTAKDSDADQVRGLEAGADDFVSKSAAPIVLLARVRKAFERLANRFACEVPHEMTKAEGCVYRLFKSKPGTLFTYPEITAAIGGEGYRLDDSTVRSYVKSLRRKLPAGEGIVCVRNVGYGIADTPADTPPPQTKRPKFCYNTRQRI